MKLWGRILFCSLAPLYSKLFRSAMAEVLEFKDLSIRSQTEQCKQIWHASEALDVTRSITDQLQTTVCSQHEPIQVRVTHPVAPPLDTSLYTLLTQPLGSSTNSNDSWIKPEEHALNAFSLHQIFEIHLKWVQAVTLCCHTRTHEHSHLRIIHTCMHKNQFTFQILASTRQKKRFKMCNKYITTSTYFIEDMDEKLQAV
jgi:hypothetical protein